MKKTIYLLGMVFCAVPLVAMRGDMDEDEILRLLEEESIQKAIERSLLDQQQQQTQQQPQNVFNFSGSFNPNVFVSQPLQERRNYRFKSKGRRRRVYPVIKKETSEEKTLVQQYLKNIERYRLIQRKKLSGKTLLFILPAPTQEPKSNLCAYHTWINGKTLAQVTNLPNLIPLLLRNTVHTSSKYNMVDGSSFMKKNGGRMTAQVSDVSQPIYRTVVENGTDGLALNLSLTSLCVDTQKRNVIDRLKKHGKELLLVNVGVHWITILVECFTNHKGNRRMALWLADSSNETKIFGPMRMYGNVIRGLADTLETHLNKK